MQAIKVAKHSMSTRSRKKMEFVAFVGVCFFEERNMSSPDDACIKLNSIATRQS